MCRLGLLLTTGVLFCAPLCAQEPDQPTALKQALALQKVVQQVIADAEPAIASILVSRSDAYQRFGQGPSPEYPGKLGHVDLVLLERQLRKLGLAHEERDRLLRQLDLSDRNSLPEAYGSGVVIDSSGLVLTSYHVIRAATRIFVRLPGGKSSYADIHAADPRSDLAILRLLDERLDLKALPLGDGGKVQRGQFVVALANPHAAGFQDGQPSSSFGIISNLRRRAPEKLREDERSKTLHHHGTLLQTDARLALGSSGGALVNLRGELLGITTALAALQGSDITGGFAIPLDSPLQQIIAILRRGEEVEYGFLGVGVERREEAPDGVTLTHITPGSPAEKAGLRERDVIVALNNQAVPHRDDLFRLLSTLLAGSRINLEVRRNGSARKENVVCVLARFHIPGKVIAASSQRPWFRGLRVDYSSVLVQLQLSPAHVQRIPAGVLVSDILPNTPAATAVLRVGDVITHVNNQAVETPAEFYRLVRQLGGPIDLTLHPTPGQPPARVTLN